MKVEIKEIEEKCEVKRQQLLKDQNKIEEIEEENKLVEFEIKGEQYFLLRNITRISTVYYLIVLLLIFCTLGDDVFIHILILFKLIFKYC